MRVLLQRVTKASVTVNGEVTGEIDAGLVLLVGVGAGDSEAHADRLADKIINLRIFNDENGKFNRSLLDVQGGALVVSQFTLFADSKKGRRPSFTDAAGLDIAKPLCDYFAERLRAMDINPVGEGVFGAHMDVRIDNDGPVTLWLDTDEIGV
jgi:D-tyrosyl-tRNA(Tyr) deacylase